MFNVLNRPVRGKVEPFLYEDVVPCLQWLRKIGMKCVVLTDGNARLTPGSKLEPFFDNWLNAGDVGTLKPSWLSFFSAVSSAGVAPSRTLCIGDSYEKDVVGSMKVGITAVYIERESVERSLPPLARPQPDVTIKSLKELKESLVRFINKRNVPSL